MEGETLSRPSPDVYCSLQRQRKEVTNKWEVLVVWRMEVSSRVGQVNEGGIA